MNRPSRRIDSARQRAATLFDQGLSRSRVAHLLGISRTTSSAWYRRWQAGGARALATTHRRGPRFRLDAHQQQRVQSAIARGPRHLGLDQDRWSLAALAHLIERTTGVRYHSRHVGRVLRRLGWLVSPVGDSADDAFRRVAVQDPDGNWVGLDEKWRNSGSEG